MAIRCKNLTLEYEKGFKAVDNVNIDIMKNELVCLIGPNGSGKSSLLNMICGLIDPTDGEIISNTLSIL